MGHAFPHDMQILSLVSADRATITGHVTLLAFIVALDLKERGPTFLLYLIDVWPPAVVVVEVRR